MAMATVSDNMSVFVSCLLQVSRGAAMEGCQWDSLKMAQSGYMRPKRRQLVGTIGAQLFQTDKKWC